MYLVFSGIAIEILTEYLIKKWGGHITIMVNSTLRGANNRWGGICFLNVRNNKIQLKMLHIDLSTTLGGRQSLVLFFLHIINTYISLI